MQLRSLRCLNGGKNLQKKKHFVIFLVELIYICVLIMQQNSEILQILFKVYFWSKLIFQSIYQLIYINFGESLNLHCFGLVFKLGHSNDR